MKNALIGAMILALALVAVLDVGPLLGIPGAVDAIATVSAGFAFSLLHGYLGWGWKNMLAFVVITLAISFSAEAVGVATGAVFGPYHYTDLFGPKVLGVPPVIQIGYLAVGYSSIVMGRIILSLLKPVKGWAIVIASVAGAAIMVAWDVCMDPLQSTAAGDWIWHDGGAYFGVPLSNYVGWFATVFAFMLVYFLFASRTTETPRRTLASPIVAITTAITGRPINGRSTTRSRPKPSATMPMIAISADSQNGSPTVLAIAAAMNPANMTNSPWAKLIASVAL